MLYKDFVAVTCLKLNLPKTVLVPLWPCEASQVRRMLITSDHPEWASCEVKSWSKHLGFALGPGKANHSWDSALKKFRERANLWDASHLGLHFTARAYNTFVFSVLSFLWQLEEVPEEVFKAEEQVLQQLTPGPGTWRLPSDLFYLKSLFGFPIGFNSVRHVALASKLRLSFFEVTNVAAKAQELQSCITSTNFIDRPGRLSEWYHGSLIYCLFRSGQTAQSLGVNAPLEWRKILSTYVQPITLADLSRARHKFQSHLTYRLLILPKFNVNVENRVRLKMSRWSLCIPPGIVSRRILARLPLLGKLVSPRVHAALFKALWNGWTTSARFQINSKCVLGCSEAVDALGHPIAEAHRTLCRLPFYSLAHVEGWSPPLFSFK